ncbi:MAG: hypothetical protein AB7O39_03080 [Flavobacteriaceae bacterium]
MDWATVDFENIANGLLILIVGLLSWLGIKGGRERKPQQRDVEVTGALVDGGAVKMLAEAVDALAVEHKVNRQDAEKMRQAIYKCADAFDRMTHEIHETRTEIRELGKSLMNRR